jgi:hypothetical protein
VLATIAWIVLLAASLIIELLSRRESSDVTSLSQAGAWVATRVFGRAILWVLWLFVGLHLFARYGVQR